MRKVAADIGLWIYENTGFRDWLVGGIITGIVLACSTIWAMVQDVPTSLIGWFAAATTPTLLIGYVVSVEACRRTFGKQAELQIDFNRRRNYSHAHGVSDARIFVKNKNRRHKATNLCVVVDELTPLKNIKKTQPLSFQFSNVALHIERGSQGMTLDPHRHVEVFVAKYQKGGDSLQICTSEAAKLYRTNPVSHEIRILVTADNAEPVSGTFQIEFRRGVMTFQPVDRT